MQGDIIDDAKLSYENTRQTEQEGPLLPPWDGLPLGLRFALINAFRDGAHHSLNMIRHQLPGARSLSPSEVQDAG